MKSNANVCLNADIIPGHDFDKLVVPIDAEQFMQFCHKYDTPQTMLSLGWYHMKMPSVDDVNTAFTLMERFVRDKAPLSTFSGVDSFFSTLLLR